MTNVSPVCRDWNMRAPMMSAMRCSSSGMAAKPQPVAGVIRTVS